MRSILHLFSPTWQLQQQQAELNLSFHEPAWHILALALKCQAVVHHCYLQQNVVDNVIFTVNVFTFHSTKHKLYYNNQNINKPKIKVCVYV